MSCQQIFAQNSQLSILKYDISDEDFSLNSAIISTFNTTNVYIKNLNLRKCILGDSFSILYQLTNVEVNIESAQITDNICSNTAEDNETISSLFSAGKYTIKDVHILRNTFCKKIIFSTIAQLQHAYQVFDFQDIEVKDNQFQTRTNYLFFNSLYSMRSSPSHELNLARISFINNLLIKKSDNDLLTAAFIQTNKILKYSINNIVVQNHYDIQFCIIDFAKEVYINDFNCNNEEQFISQIPDQVTTGCLQISEVNKVTINKIRIISKKVKDNSLFVIENNTVKQANLSITDGEFSNLVLNQSSKNTYANPFHMRSSYQMNIIIDDCHFKNNVLTKIFNSLTYSTSGIWIENFVGITQIQNSSFENSFSDSIYGFSYIQTQVLQVDNVIFKKSSFTADPKTSQNDLFLQNGSMMNIKVESILIQNSVFQQATGNKGSFIYILSFEKQLNIDIQNSKFIEGYAKQDGSCLFIDTSGFNLNFSCTNCYFNNLYNFKTNSSAIGIEKYQNSKSKEQSTIKFIGGNIINIFGDYDNYFIESINTNIEFSDIDKIETQDFISQSLAHLELTKIQIQQQSTLLNLVDSIANIINCSFQKLKITNFSATLPLLINSDNSEINLDNIQVQNSSFVTSAINTHNSKIFLKKTYFKNVNQIKNERILDVTLDIQPNQIGSSLFIISQGLLQVDENSYFSDIDCSFNCNGGVFQLRNSNFSIKNTTIINSQVRDKIIIFYILSIFFLNQALFGGSIFVFGIQNQNLIKNVLFNGCKSQNDGGAIYLYSYSSDNFELKIENSIFQNNESIEGKGGAINILSEIMNSQFQSVIISSSIITQNTAKIGGGIQQKNISPQVGDDTIIKNNMGKLFGNDQISYPSHLKLSNLKEFLEQNPNAIVDNDIIVIDNFRSGAKIQNLVFEFLNDNDEKIFPITKFDINDYSINLKFNPNTKNLKSYSINSETLIKYDTESNIFQFKELQLVGTPASSAFLQFKSDQIQVLNITTNLYEQNYSFLIKINFRNCTTGEQFADFNGLTQCSVCEMGKYSLFVEPCQECPDGATCYGGSDITTNQGYWRKTNVSTQIIKCSNLLENCAGGSYGNNICYEGHIGALCEECDIFGEQSGLSYSKSAKYTCTRCDKIKYNFWIVGLLTIWTLLSMTFAIKGDIQVLVRKAAINTIQKNINRRSLSVSTMIMSKSPTASLSTKFVKNNFERQTTPKNLVEDKTGIFIKMLTNYLQIVGSIATFNLSIPSGIFEFPQAIGEPLKQTMNSLDCVLKDFGTYIPIIYLRLIFSLFIPIVYMILFLIGIVSYTLAKKQKKFPWYILSTASMFLIIYLQPDLVAQIIALLSCRMIGNTSYILSNISFECYTDEHKFYALVLITPLLLVWVFILPIILFLMLRKNKEKLDTIEIKLKYGFLYREYKHYSFYWEFVKMAEKIAIILSLNFYSQSIVIKAILVFIIIITYGILSLIIEPYEEKDVNQVDINSTNVCAITVLLGLFIYNNPYSYFIYISIALIIVINIWFIVKLLKMIITGYIIKIKQKIQYICLQLSKKITFFSKFVSKKKGKTINPQIKKKIQSIFQRYLDMNPSQKKTLFLKIVESQLATRHSHIFKDEQISLSIKEIAKDKYIPSLNLNNIQFYQTQSLIQNNNPTQVNIKENNNSNNIEFASSPQIMSSPSSFLILKDNCFSKNNNLMFLDSDYIELKSTVQTPQRRLQNSQINKIDIIQEDQIDVNFHESENDVEQ